MGRSKYNGSKGFYRGGSFLNIAKNDPKSYQSLRKMNAIRNAWAQPILIKNIRKD